MPCQTNIQPLYIECPANSQALYNAPNSWFEIISEVNFLKIMVQPEEYIRLKEGESPKILRTFVKPTKTVRRRETGFVVTINGEDNSKLRYILEDIESQSNQLAPEATAIRVIDYVRPDSVNYKLAIASNTNPCTIRQGFLEVEPGSGTAGYGTQRFGINGIRFSFRELKMSQ